MSEHAGNIGGLSRCFTVAYPCKDRKTTQHQRGSEGQFVQTFSHLFKPSPGTLTTSTCLLWLVRSTWRCCFSHKPPTHPEYSLNTETGLRPPQTSSTLCISMHTSLQLCQVDVWFYQLCHSACLRPRLSLASASLLFKIRCTP